MTVLTDTSVWSLALRRHRRDLSAGQEIVRRELADLIRGGMVRLIGPVRQELLSGIRSEDQFERLRHQLSYFDDVPLVTEDFEEAARASNRCRAAGVTGSNTDFLICAVAMRHEWPIFTTDRDFTVYAKHLPIALHAPRTGRAQTPGS
jgi:hypothetical protein